MTDADRLALFVASLALVVSVTSFVRDVIRTRRAARVECHRLLGEAWVYYSEFLGKEAPDRDPAATQGFLVKVDQAEIVDPKNVRLRVYKGYAAELHGDIEAARDSYRAATRRLAGPVALRVHHLLRGTGGRLPLPRGVPNALIQLARVTPERSLRLQYLTLAESDRSTRAHALMQQAHLWAETSENGTAEVAPDLSKACSLVNAAIELERERATLHRGRAQILEKVAQAAPEADRDACIQLAIDAWETAVKTSTQVDLGDNLVQLALCYGRLAGSESETSAQQRAISILELAAAMMPPNNGYAHMMLAAVLADRVNSLTDVDADHRKTLAAAAILWFKRGVARDPRYVLPTEKWDELRSQMEAIV